METEWPPVLSNSQTLVVNHIIGMDNKVLYIGWPRFNGATTALYVAAKRLVLQHGKSVCIVGSCQRITQKIESLFSDIPQEYRDSLQCISATLRHKKEITSDYLFFDAVPTALLDPIVETLIDQNHTKVVISYAESDCTAYGFTADPLQQPTHFLPNHTHVVIQNLSSSQEISVNLKTIYKTPI